MRAVRVWCSPGPCERSDTAKMEASLGQLKALPIPTEENREGTAAPELQKILPAAEPILKVAVLFLR